MARQLPPGRVGRAGRVGRVVTTAKRLSPVALEAYRRWQNLTPEQKERYMRMAREYAGRGRHAYDQAQRRRGRRL